MEDIGRGVLANEVEFSNPVQDYAPENLAAGSQVNRPGRPREPSPSHEGSGLPDRDADGDDDEPEPGLIENAVTLARASDRSEAILNAISEATVKVGNDMEAHTARLDRATKNLGEKGAGVVLGLLREAATDIDQFTDTVAPLNMEFRVVVHELADAVTWIAKQRDIAAEERGSVLEEIAAIRGAEATMAEAYLNVTGFATSLTEMPHMDRQLTASARRAAIVVTETAEIIQTAQAEFSRAGNVLEERLPPEEQAREGVLDLN